MKTLHKEVKMNYKEYMKKTGVTKKAYVQKWLDLRGHFDGVVFVVEGEGRVSHDSYFLSNLIVVCFYF